MTKYILHGGCVGRKTDNNKKFFSEIVKNLPNPIQILCVYFSKKDKSKWPELLENDKENFYSISTQKTLIFEMADENTDVFIEQIKKTDVIYIRGWDSTHILQKYLEKIESLDNLWNGKVIAGSSAGATVLSEYYYENDDEEKPYNKGLWILPIKIFCHYTEEQNNKLEKLEKYGKNIKDIYAIKEEEYIVIEI